MRRDIIDHRDILIMSLFYRGSTKCLANVYSDDNGTTIRVLKDKAECIPALYLMAGDFNCHTPEWDPGVSGRRGMAMALLETAGLFGASLSGYTNPGLTFISRTQGLRQSVLDLVFVKSTHTLVNTVTREVDLQGPSDHIPVSGKIALGDTSTIECCTLAKGSEEEVLSSLFFFILVLEHSLVPIYKSI